MLCYCCTFWWIKRKPAAGQLYSSKPVIQKCWMLYCVVTLSVNPLKMKCIPSDFVGAVLQRTHPICVLQYVNVFKRTAPTDIFSATKGMSELPVGMVNIRTSWSVMHMSCLKMANCLLAHTYLQLHNDIPKARVAVLVFCNMKQDYSFHVQVTHNWLSATGPTHLSKQQKRDLSLSFFFKNQIRWPSFWFSGEGGWQSISF